MTHGRARCFTGDFVHRLALPYLEYAPAGDVPDAGRPLVLFLHGAGEKGDDIEWVRRAALPALLERGLAPPATVIAPQCRPGPGWRVEDLEHLLDALAARPDIDATRIHLTGVSMGARGAWELAYRRATDLASIVAVCGLGIPNLAPLVAAVPTWLFHGTADDIVPEARSAEMAYALEKAGGHVRYTPLAGRPHDCGAEVYADPALWNWMLAHAKRRAE